MLITANFNVKNAAALFIILPAGCTWLEKKKKNAYAVTARTLMPGQLVNQKFIFKTKAMNEKKIIQLRQKLLQQIKDHMEKNNITQQEAADKCGWQQQTVQRMLNGDFGPKLDNLLMLCTAVGINLQGKSVLYKMDDEG